MSRGLFDGDAFDAMFGAMAQAPVTVPMRLLGFEELPANHEQIKKAFRSKVMAAHPDLATYTVPSLKEAAELLVAKEPDVQELQWARDVLLTKVKGPPPKKRPKTDEEEAFEAARERHQAAQATPNPIPVTEPRARHGTREKRARRPVTRGCAGCGKAFEAGEEIWRIRDNHQMVVKRRYCAACGEKRARWRRKYRNGTGIWRGSCQRCSRALVLVDHTKQLWFCSCEEPDLMPVPVTSRPGKLEDKCARCNNWSFKPENWWETSSCGSACTKALGRAKARSEPEPRPCEVCDTKFTPGRADARFCSAACRQFAYRQRKAGR